MSLFLLPSTYRTGYSPALVAILPKIRPHNSKKVLKAKGNFCDRIHPSFKAKSPKILILEGLNYLAQQPNFSPDWPKNSAESCNTGGCSSGG